MEKRCEHTSDRVRVVNKRKDQFDVYIGRGAALGNPYAIGEGYLHSKVEPNLGGRLQLTSPITTPLK